MRILIRLICLLVVVFFSFQSLKAQSSERKFYVVNKESRIPIIGATVSNTLNQILCFSDENGLVRLPLSSYQDTIVKINAVGFLTKELIINTELPVIIECIPSIATLADITVKSNSNAGLFKTISDLDIHIRPINNSQEVLRMIPGLFIGQHAGGGKAEQIFLRGFDIDHGTDIQISVDGMPVNMVSHAHGQGYADLHFVIPELIERVNFNKGPYYAEKGNFTTAGYVEFATKNFLEKNFVKAEAGLFNTYRAITAINLLPSSKSIRKQSLYVAGEASFTQGYFESSQDFNRYNVLLKYYTPLNSTTTINAIASVFSSKWDASGQIPNRAVAAGTIGFYGAIDDTEGGKTSRENVSVQLNTNLGAGKTMSHQFFYNRYAFELYSNFTFFKEDTINGDQIRQKEDRQILGYNGIYKSNNRFGKLAGTFTTGVQFRYDIIDDIELTRTANRNVNTEDLKFGDIKEMNLGAYASQKISFSPKLDITASLRADHFNHNYDDELTGIKSSANANILSPKLNFNYQLNKNIQLYSYNGRGFHSNDSRVAVVQNGKEVLPAAYGTDLGGIFKLGKKLVLQSALWYLWLDQEFVYVGDEAVVEQGGKTKRMGLDVSARYELKRYLFADIDISLAKPLALDVPKEESYIPLAPKFTSVGGITYKREKGWSGSLRYRYMANRAANETNSVTAKGYCVTDLGVNYMKNNWEAGISIQNLLNTKWKETQFDTESKLFNESQPVSEIHFTPGTPFFARLNFTVFF